MGANTVLRTCISTESHPCLKVRGQRDDKFGYVEKRLYHSHLLVHTEVITTEFQWEIYDSAQWRVLFLST